MNDENQKLSEKGLANLAIDPDLLARELAAQLAGDPLDEIELDKIDGEQWNSSKECDVALKWLQSGNNERLQGLRVFCEHRDPRALPFLLPLLDEPSPVVRMSAVYALGRNPCPQAIDLLLHLLRFDSNAYVRKATAWSLGNYTDAPVLEPLINALKQDVAAVRLWASSSLAEVGLNSAESSSPAANQLLESLQVDGEPIVRSNCIWSLGRLYELLSPGIQIQIVETFISVLLNDREPSVRYEARTALEQLDNPEVQKKLKSLIDDGQLV
ncbi:HEAT repeat domain-containing protein [Prochlorococcus marinus]|uniref:HEAT repeat domain-containing protein n=1 Tax=Prochlorococcus marinus TaxID=1219 RepID=UPI0022B3C373|nr:HEAT repeat domain-containing protein [Prochlorococcus marinus]